LVDEVRQMLEYTSFKIPLSNDIHVYKHVAMKYNYEKLIIERFLRSRTGRPEQLINKLPSPEFLGAFQPCYELHMELNLKETN